MRSAFLSVLALGLLAHPAQAQVTQTYEKVAVAGKAQQVDGAVSVDPDCHPVKFPEVSVVDGPRQGQVTTLVGQDYPNFPATNLRAKCNTHKLPALKLIYTAPAGATGDDIFTVEYIDKFGTPRRVRYHVTLR